MSDFPARKFCKKYILLMELKRILHISYIVGALKVRWNLEWGKNLVTLRGSIWRLQFK